MRRFPRVHGGRGGQVVPGHLRLVHGNWLRTGMSRRSGSRPARRRNSPIRSTTRSVRAVGPSRPSPPAGRRRPSWSSEVPGAGDLDPSPFTASNRVGASRPGRPAPASTSSGKWARPMLVSISPAWSSLRLEDRRVSVGGTLYQLHRKRWTGVVDCAAPGAPTSGRCRRGR